MQIVANETYNNGTVAPSAPRRSIVFNAGLLVIAVGILFGLLILKSRSVIDPSVDPVIIFYTFFMTLFQLSRIVSALMYKWSYRVALEAAPPYADGYRPKLSFVIPCMNEEKEIQRTITTCFEANYPRHLLEVIVINDASTDHTLERTMEIKEKYPDLVVVDWTVNRGKRHGMAEGFKRATGEIVVQLDSDSRIEPEDVPNIVEPFRNPMIGAVSYLTDPANADQNLLTKTQTAYYFMAFHIMKAAESTYRVVFCCSGCASAYRRSIVLPILDGWLKETFLGKPVTWGDDRSLTNQVIKQGYETLYSDRVKAYTIVPSTFRQFLKQQIRWKKGWFVNSIFASRFIVQRDPFVAFFYFFPLTIISLLTPVVAFRAFVYTPLTHGLGGTYLYIGGVFLVAGLMAVVYRFKSRSNKYWPYVFLWSTLNMFLLTYILVYALATIQDRGWGTRKTVSVLETPKLKPAS